MVDKPTDDPVEEFFQIDEALCDKLGKLLADRKALRARVAHLKADAGMIIAMLHARPDIWRLCGFEEQRIVKQLCDTLNADWFAKPSTPTPDPRDARIAVLEAALREVMRLSARAERDTRGDDRTIKFIADIARRALGDDHE